MPNTVRKRQPLLRIDDRAIEVANAGESHEANFVLDNLPGAIGVRYKLLVAAV
jgi:hypothetical protein